MKTIILSNVNINPINQYFSNENTLIEIPGYNNWQTELVNPNSILNKSKPELLILILDGYNLSEEVQHNLNQINDFKEIIQNYIYANPNVNLIVSNLDFYPNQIDSFKRKNSLTSAIDNQWLTLLTNLNQENDQFYIFDMKEVISRLGKTKFYSEKLWYLGSVRYSPLAFEAIYASLKMLIESFYKARKKCLVLDLDNTLWGGILGDDGLSGIKLDVNGFYSCYYDFQKQIKKIKETGVILAICSKNEFINVIEVFKKHPNMILKEDDFALIKANWNPKSENILQIARELNIGTDSIVVIDDSVFEQEEIRHNIDDINIPEFPKDPSLLRSFAVEVFNQYFYLNSLKDSDTKKTQQIKSKLAFDSDKNKSTNIDDFLLSLNMKIEISINNLNQIERLAEITQKTNQFNLSGKRFTKNQLIELIDSGYYVFSGSVIDKFGNHGIVLLAIINPDSTHTELVNYYMSCRVFGRYLENEFFINILKFLKEKNISSIFSNYISTLKNQNSIKFYSDLGFTLLKDNGIQKRFFLDLSNYKLSTYTKFFKIRFNHIS